MGLLRRAFIFTVILLLVVVAGLSMALYIIQQRHGQIITEESYAVQRLEITDRAALILAVQREAVAATLLEPVDHQTFAQQTAAFQAAMKTPLLVSTPQGGQQQHSILVGQEKFSRRALHLPPHPLSAQVQALRAQGEMVFTALINFRARHAINLATLRTSEGEQRWLSFLMIIVTTGVIVILAISGFIMLDRLGRRQSEATALRATDKLRREFVAFAAHELRNPTSAIKTGVSLLREPDVDPDIRLQVVESITRSTDALERLISNLLAMGRSEEGRLQLHRVAISISSFFDNLLAELSIYHPEIEKRVQRQLPDALVDADPEYLQLVIANIVDNAVKYSPPSSPITVTGEIKERMLAVHLHNLGPGIPPEELPRIFEMYETTGTAPYSLRRGVGLGLYMARLLIEAQDGTIWAESRPNEGATFSFTLPLAQIPPNETAAMSDVTE